MNPDRQADIGPPAPSSELLDLDDTMRYAAYRGVELTASYVHSLSCKLGPQATRRYVDKLGEIMDAAATLGLDCPQTLASRRLSLAGGDAQQVIDGFATEARRRLDRQRAGCSATVPPREFRERTNALANCGCPRCRGRLALLMQRYIGSLVNSRLCDGLYADEARAEANLMLIEAAETWPGGNFTGWFAQVFKSHVNEIYRSHLGERETISLDAEAVLHPDNGARTVPLYERVPDRTVDVLNIVLLRERCWEWIFDRHRACTSRLREYATHWRPAYVRAVGGDTVTGRIVH